jgi:hypothetical protein
MARYETKIKAGARPFLEPGEEVLAAVVARPRGWTQSSAGHAGPGWVGASMGAKKQHENVEAAKQARFEIASPMALAVTDRRLLCFGISSPVGMGIGGSIKALVSEAKLSEVDAIETKRLAAGHTMTVTVRGVPFVLEIGAGANAKGLAAAFAQAKGS